MAQSRVVAVEVGRSGYILKIDPVRFAHALAEKSETREDLRKTPRFLV